MVFDRFIHREVITEDPQVFRDAVEGQGYVPNKTIFEPAVRKVILDNKSRRIHGYLIGVHVTGVGAYKQFVTYIPDTRMKLEDIAKIRALVSLVTLFDLHSALGVSTNPNFFSSELIDVIAGYKSAGIPSAPLSESLMGRGRLRRR